MKLSKHSTNKLLEKFALHSVSKEYADPLFNYLVYGFNPGSFWTAALANDFMGAIAKSHPANTVNALKHVINWIYDEIHPKRMVHTTKFMNGRISVKMYEGHTWKKRK